MAGREVQFLSETGRNELIKELKDAGELDYEKTPKDILEKAATLEGSEHAVDDFGTGCLACGEDDDHANILLCETCNAEYHTYCLSPPLRSVPAGDWYCAQCKITTVEDDGLEKLVTALPPAFTSRFGEIVWAQGGTGFGWWPAFIYDPRLTVGSARQLARKNLGKRHLVYFFECHYAPFSCVTDSKLTTWEDGMIEDYHMGKTAKASGRNRMLLFNQAMQAATLEMGKPIELRMEFNHTDQPQVLPSPKFKKPKRRSLTPERQQRSDFENLNPEEKNVKRLKIRGFPLLSDSVHLNPEKHQICVQKNLKGAIASLAKSQAQVESDLSSDSELFCKLSKCSNDGTSPTSIGFIRLPSRAKATFEDARKAIEDELASDTFVAKQEWRFYVPNLGPMSRKQETTLGPLHSFLRLSTYGWTLGDGTTLMSPLHLLIFEPEPPSSE